MKKKIAAVSLPERLWVFEENSIEGKNEKIYALVNI